MVTEQAYIEANSENPTVSFTMSDLPKWQTSLYVFGWDNPAGGAEIEINFSYPDELVPGGSSKSYTLPSHVKSGNILEVTVLTATSSQTLTFTGGTFENKSVFGGALRYDGGNQLFLAPSSTPMRVGLVKYTLQSYEDYLNIQRRWKFDVGTPGYYEEDDGACRIDYDGDHTFTITSVTETVRMTYIEYESDSAITVDISSLYVASGSCGAIKLPKVPAMGNSLINPITVSIVYGGVTNTSIEFTAGEFSEQGNGNVQYDGIDTIRFFAYSSAISGVSVEYLPAKDSNSLAVDKYGFYYDKSKASLETDFTAFLRTARFHFLANQSIGANALGLFNFSLPLVANESIELIGINGWELADASSSSLRTFLSTGNELVSSEDGEAVIKSGFKNADSSAYTVSASRSYIEVAFRDK